MTENPFNIPMEPDPVLEQEIQTVIEKIRSAKFMGVGAISGEVVYDYEISKLKRLDITPNSKLIFKASKNTSILIVAAEEVYIQAPPTTNEASTITFQTRFDLAVPKPPKGRRGADGAPKTGQSGGNGEPGSPGLGGITFDAPDFCFVFQKLYVQDALPAASTLLQFRFEGMTGGNGGEGGDGGDAGNGGSGTDAENDRRLGIEFGCRHGPGRGGDTGRPGPGGRGGDAGRGGKGGDVIVICPREEAAKVAFAAFVAGGSPGTPGGPGHPGNTGQPGGGGELTSFCVESPGSGSVQVPNPHDLGPGNAAAKGTSGTYSVVARDNRDLFRL